MYSDYLNVVEGVRGLLHNIDVSLLGVIDRVFVVCHKYGVFVKWCPKMHNRIIYKVVNLVRSPRIQVSYNAPICKFHTLFCSIWSFRLGIKKAYTYRLEPRLKLPGVQEQG